MREGDATLSTAKSQLSITGVNPSVFMREAEGFEEHLRVFETLFTLFKNSCQ